MRALSLVLVLGLSAAGCSSEGAADGGRDAAADARGDVGPSDAGDGSADLDAGTRDGGGSDGGGMDGGEPDAGADAGTDAGMPDAGTDAGMPDAGTDAGMPDAGTDAGMPDAGTGACVSGATGTHAARFRWAGSGSTAYVQYETNTLPDTSRWRAGAYSSSFGYTPVWGDPFLGPGGLDMSGTVFMDIELSTAGLSAISAVSIAIFGRSYSTGSSGSYSWMTFSGSGSLPSGSIANSTPYAWYRGDATSAFRAGDAGVLLRIRPGPPSGSLVVNRVEVCFD